MAAFSRATAVRIETPSVKLIVLKDFPAESGSAYRFYTDLCHVLANEPLEWPVYEYFSTSGTLTKLDATLAFEVIDDSFANNIALFATYPVLTSLRSDLFYPVLYPLF